MRKDGRIEIKVRNSEGKRQSFYGYTKAEAEENARKALRPGDKLSGYYEHTYLPTLVGRAEGYILGIGKNIENHVLPVFGRRDIQDITRPELQRFFNNLTVKPSSKRLIKKHLSAVFSLAVSDDLIYKNPVSSVRIAGGIEREAIVLTFAQLHDLLAAANDRQRPTLVLAMIGLRRGEICGAAWTNFDNGVLHVCQQVKQCQGKWAVSPVLKTPQSDRFVPIPAKLLSMIPKTAVFMAPDGNKHQTPSQVWRLVRAAGKNIGIDNLVPHDLRHTFVSLMENELESPRRVAMQLAGKAKKGEMDRYSQSSLSTRQRWMERYAEAVVKVTTEGVLKVQEK